MFIEANHVLSGDLVGLRLSVHHPNLCSSRGRIQHVLEWNRHESAVLNRDHRGSPAIELVLRSAIPEIARVLNVVGNWIGAA